MHSWTAGGGNGDALQAERKKQGDRLWAGLFEENKAGLA